MEHLRLDHLQASLNDAKALSQAIADVWPLQSSFISSAQPLWQDTLAPVFGEWAQICGQAIGWLDQVPLVMVEAGKKSSGTDTLTAYKNISAKLDALLKDVTAPPAAQKGTLLGLNFGRPEQVPPLSRLEKILEEKYALDAAASTRLKTLRAGLSLSEQSRQLAAIVSDALPALRAELDGQMDALGLEDAHTMVEAQKRAQRGKSFERARSSLDLVSARLAQEFSTPSLINQDQLEESVSQETLMHSRLNALSTQIGQRIASEEVNAQSAVQAQLLPSISPVQELTVVATGELAELKSVSLVPSPAKKTNWLSKIMPSLNIDGSERATHKKLKKLKNNYTNNLDGDRTFWVDANLATADPAVSATTKIPKTNISVLDFILTKRQSGSINDGFTLDVKIKVIERLIKRETALNIEFSGQPTQSGAGNGDNHWVGNNGEIFGHPLNRTPLSIDWDALLYFALRVVLHSNSVETTESALRIHSFAVRNSGYQEPDKGDIDLIGAINCNYSFIRKKLNPEFIAAAVHTMTPDSLYDRMCSYRHDPIEIWKHYATAFSPEHCELVNLRSIERKIGRGGPTKEDASYIKAMTAGALQRLASNLMSQETLYSDWIACVVGANAFKVATEEPVNPDNKWAHLFNDFDRLHNNQNPSAPISSVLLDHAIRSRDIDLLDQIQDRYAQGDLDAPIDIKTPGSETGLMGIMRIQKQEGASFDANPDFWCRVFHDQINDVFREEYIDPETAFEHDLEDEWDEWNDVEPYNPFDDEHVPEPSMVKMTPLSWACANKKNQLDQKPGDSRRQSKLYEREQQNPSAFSSG